MPMVGRAGQCDDMQSAVREDDGKGHDASCSAEAGRPRRLPHEANNLTSDYGGFQPESTMRESQCTDAQIVAILREAEAGTAIAELLRKHNISHPTF